MDTFETPLLRCTWEPGWHCADPVGGQKKIEDMDQEEYWNYQMHEKEKVGFDVLEGLVITNKGSYDCTGMAAPDSRSIDLTISCPWFEVTAPEGKVVSCTRHAGSISCKAR